MRRIALIALVLFCLCAASALADDLAIGGEYLFDASAAGLTHDALVSLRLWPQSFQLGVGATFSNPASFSVTGDWWLKEGSISGSPLGYYVAVGVYVNVPSFAFGARLPLGLQVWPLGRLLEFFIEAVPYAGIIISPTSPTYGIGVGAGFRFWL